MSLLTRITLPYFRCFFPSPTNFVRTFANSRGLLNRHFVQRRSFHSSPVCNDTHAILVGGGVPGRTISRLWRKHFPDLAEYKDMTKINEELIKRHSFDKKNISILFGNGDKAPKVINAPSLLESMYNRVRGIESYEIMPELPNFRGAASLENLEVEYQRLSEKIKPNDRVWIIVSGHGGRFQGTLLWNEYLTTKLLRPINIKEFLGTFDERIKFSIFVSSCYSGQFLPLTKDNVSIVSSSSSKKVSYYNATEGCLHFQKIFSQMNVPFLRTHAEESERQGNFHASDSLTYYIESVFEKRVGERKVQKIIENAAIRLNGPYLSYLMQAGVITFVVLDPTKITLYLYQFKAVAAIGKVAIPLMKILASVCFSESYNRLEGRCQNTNTYKNWLQKKTVA